MSQISENLNAAADYIDKVGWTQGDYIDRRGAVCLVGGLCHSLKRPIHQTEESDEYEAMQNFLGVSLVPSWNDAPGRTKEEVTQALRDAAIKYQSDAFTSGGSNDHT